MNGVKRDGRRFQYPDSYIEFLAFLKTGFQIPYRTVEGVVRGLSNYIKGLKEMHFTQIRRRMLRLNPTVGFDYDSDADEPVTLIVDSTGLSTTKKGAYIEQMWVKKKRKFIKLHIGIDEKTKKIVEFDVTTPRVADTKRFKKIVKGAARKVGEENIVKVYGDKAHDSRENFRDYPGKLCMALMVGERAIINHSRPSPPPLARTLGLASVLARSFSTGSWNWHSHPGVIEVDYLDEVIYIHGLLRREVTSELPPYVIQSELMLSTAFVV